MLRFRKFIRRLIWPIEPWVVPLYEYVLKKIRYLDPGLKSFRAVEGRVEVGRHMFGADPRLAVILAAGASNIANEGDPKGCFVPQRGVFDFNFFDGRIYEARDPLLGATADRSNVLTRIGDALSFKPGSTSVSRNLIWPQTSVQKSWWVLEKLRFTLRGDVNNIYKYHNFNPPNSTFNSTDKSSVGTFTGTRGSFSDIGTGRWHTIVVLRLDW